MSGTTLRVLAFDGGYNLPLWVGLERGFFAAQGLALELAWTPNSAHLVDSLMNGTAHVGLAGLDNIVACQQAQGEAQVAQPPDLFAFMGGDRGFLTLMAAAHIERVQDLRGKTVSVDALTTGFAFVLREMLALAGVAQGEVQVAKAGATALRYRALLEGAHDATLLRTPFELQAAQAGCVPLAEANAMLGAYMGTVAAARRAWAARNEDTLLRFLRGYRASMDWLADARNRTDAQATLRAHTEGLDAALAARACEVLLDPAHGLIRDLGFDEAGVATVLRLRAKYAPAPTAPVAPVDTSYLRRL